MDFFLYFRMDSVAWSLRRLYCPVSKSALVLEIGSGGNPYFRANVLSDAYMETGERWFVPLVHDRPTIVSFAERLPFKDDVFDFAIASHVLEHSTDPEAFLNEMQRVAKAGYIEVPDAFMERVTAYTFHRLEIYEENGGLVIKKKRGHVEDPEIRKLFTQNAAGVFQKWASRFPFHFHVRYYWRKDSGGIRYRIINPNYKFDWEIVEPDAEYQANARVPLISRIKRLLLRSVRIFFSQHGRNKNIDISSLMRCASCGGEDFSRNSGNVICNACSTKYRVL